jgi:hypothetical protein
MTDEMVLRPLGRSLFTRLGFAEPPGWAALAEVYEDSHKALPDGVLVCRGGRYALCAGGAIRGLDISVVLRALAEVETDDDGRVIDSPFTVDERRQLAALVRRWLDGADLSVFAGARLLGLSSRTLEGVVQGRGFRYPLMLALAIRAFERRDSDVEPAGFV